MERKVLAGWVAIYNGKRVEVPKSSTVTGIYEAKVTAEKILRVPKSKRGYMAIVPAYTEGDTQ